MIVVEGPDGAGKTTLIEKLVRGTALDVAPRVVSKDAEAMVDLKQWVEDTNAQGFQPTIFDRHRLFSEPIYGPLLRERFEPGFEDPEWFTDQLSAFYDCDPIVVYCLPPFELVWKNVRNDPDNRVVASRETIRAVWGAYFNKAMTEYSLRPGNVWMYDYDQWGLRTEIQASLIRAINTRVRDHNRHMRGRKL